MRNTARLPVRGRKPELRPAQGVGPVGVAPPFHAKELEIEAKRVPHEATQVSDEVTLQVAPFDEEQVGQDFNRVFAMS